jgi:hypothetical protein
MKLKVIVTLKFDTSRVISSGRITQYDVFALLVSKLIACKVITFAIIKSQKYCYEQRSFNFKRTFRIRIFITAEKKVLKFDQSACDQTRIGNWTVRKVTL